MTPEGIIQHAVTLDLITVREITNDETLLGSGLQPIMEGINPFTERIDRISHVTNLVLVNEGIQSVTFGNNSAFTMTVVLQ